MPMRAVQARLLQREFKPATNLDAAGAAPEGGRTFDFGLGEAQPASATVACAADSRAIGTRNGEQET